MTSPSPELGPATTDDVLAWLQVNRETAVQRETVADVVAGVNAVIRRWLRPVSVVLNPDGTIAAETWAPDHVLGAVMLSGRVYRRRNSPGGVEVMGPEGVAYVARTDPDVAMLLEMGAYTSPRIG